jgi:tetratricopeptide (TPR) repeat protein
VLRSEGLSVLVPAPSAEDERLVAIGAAAASVLRTTDYHQARTEDIAAAVSVDAVEHDGRSRGGRRSAVWVYSEVKSRRVLVALAIHHAWREYLDRSGDQLDDSPCLSLRDARARVASALTEVVRFHRAESDLVRRVGFGIGDIATAEKRRDSAAAGPVWPATELGVVAREGFDMRVAAFGAFLVPHLRAALQSVTCPRADEVDRSAWGLSNLVFRACLADPSGPVDRTVEALAAYWFERDLVRLAGSWVLDLDGAERSLDATRRRGTDPRAEAYARAALIRVLLEAGTLHQRGADESASLAASLMTLTGRSADAADLTALCDAASRHALSLRCTGDLAAARAADELSLQVARDALRDPALEARALTNLGDTLSRSGDADAALELITSAQTVRTRLLAEAGSPTEHDTNWRRLSWTEEALAAAQVRAGRTVEGLRLAEATLVARRGRVLPPGMLSQAQLLHAEALMAAGHPGAAREAALAVYHDPHAQIARTGTRPATVLILLARIARAAGRPEAAVSLLADAPVRTPWFAARVSPRLSHEAHWVLGGALTESGDPAQAAELLRERADVLPESDPVAILLRVELAGALLAAGAAAEALELLPDVAGLRPTLAAEVLLVRDRCAVSAGSADDDLLLAVLGLEGMDPLHPLRLTARVELAERRTRRGDLGGAAGLLEPFVGVQLLAHGRTLLGADHPLLRRAVAALERIGVDHAWGPLPPPLSFG